MTRANVEALRGLLERAKSLRSSLRADLKPFLHERDNKSFRRLPTSGSGSGDINPTTTCSCLMALSMTGEIESFYDGTERAVDALKIIVGSKWVSSKLEEDNPFTTCLVLRAAGLLKQAG